MNCFKCRRPDHRASECRSTNLTCFINFGLFPLNQLDIILGMNWLQFNCVFINCFNKLVKFLESNESTESIFMTARQVKIPLRESAQVFIVFVSLSGKSERMIIDLHLVCEFPS